MNDLTLFTLGFGVKTITKKIPLFTTQIDFNLAWVLLRIIYYILCSIPALTGNVKKGWTWLIFFFKKIPGRLWMENFELLLIQLDMKKLRGWLSMWVHVCELGWVNMAACACECSNCHTESNRLDVFRVLRRNFKSPLRPEVTLFTKAREVYKPFSLPYCKDSVEGKRISQRGHWRKSHFKFQHSQDLKQLIGMGYLKLKKNPLIKFCTLNSQQLKAERNFDMVPPQENNLQKVD